MKKIISVAVALCIAITSLFTSVYAMADSKVTSGDIKKKLNDTAIYLLSEKKADFDVENVKSLVSYINAGIDVNDYKDEFTKSVKENLDSNSGKIIAVVGYDENNNWAPIKGESAGVYANVITALDYFGFDVKNYEGINLVENFKNVKLNKDHENQYLFSSIFAVAEKYGLDMIEYINEDGVKKGINPFDYGSSYTDIMKTQALKQALNKYGFTAAFGGGRRDEEKSRAKERIFSFRNENHAWDPKNQRPEMWKLYNSRINKGESIRVFPISNWTETDIWQYIKRENIDIVPLYYAAKRPVVERDGMLIMVDDDRMKLREGEKIEYKNVRFRTLGCYPLTGGIESNATTLDEIIDETLSAVSSERTTRVIDNEAAGSMERRKREGYF